MSDRANLITSIVETISNIKIIRHFTDVYGNVLGRVQVQQSEVVLEFDVEIKPPYPLQFHETETIRFINPELIEYNHVNRDGSICIQRQKRQRQYESTSEKSI